MSTRRLILLGQLLFVAALGAGVEAQETDWLAAKSKVTTGWMLPAIRIPLDPTDRQLTSVGLEIDELTEEGGTGVVLFDTSVVQFDQFGDGTVAEAVPVQRAEVELVAVNLRDKGPEGRQLFEIRFPDGQLANALYLVLSPGPITRDRLLVVGDATLPPSKALAEGVLHLVIPLEAPGARQWCLPTPGTGSLWLRSFKFHVREEDGSRGIRSIEVTRDNGGTIYLKRDPNGVSYNRFGDIEWSTLLGSFPLLFEAKEVPLKDPTGGNRRVLKLSPVVSAPGTFGAQHDPRREYSLVISPRRQCADRLLVYESGELTRVLPLVDISRQRFLQQIALLGSSPVEIDVLRETRSLVGDRISPQVQDGHISEVTLYRRGIRADVLQRLADLPHLQILTIMGVDEEISADELRPLSTLQQINHLSFFDSVVTDSMLKPVESLSNLTYLRIYDETPHGEDPASVPHMTDDGVELLLSLKRLENLSLCGPGITDAGLARLSEFASLSDLYLHRTEVSLEALARFAQQRPHVKYRLQKAKEEKGELKYIQCEVELSKGGVTISGELVRDEQLAAICTLTETRTLSLGGRSSVTDDGLEVLKRVDQLESLQLRHNQTLTGDGLKFLPGLSKLTDLSLWYCRNIDDRAVEHLSKMNGLRKLSLGGTQISTEGRARLRVALPDCEFGS